MVTVIKVILGVFMLTGLAISLYGCREILGTISLVKSSTERTRGVFVGYDEEIVTTRSSSPSPTDWGRVDFEDTTSLIIYPRFEFVDKDGARKQVSETKMHLTEHFKPGQEVEIILSPDGNHRLAGFQPLFLRDICVLLVGLCFMLIPSVIWSVVIPSLQTPAGERLETRMRALYEVIASTRVGPVTVRGIMKGTAVVVAFIIIFTIVHALTPFWRQMRLGFGYGLIEALEHKRYDEARELILKKKGINTVNEYDQNPLLLAIEAGRPDLARLLIEAGADVNIKSKMYMTPLRAAARSGDVETVRLLLSRGASPDAPEDETPPALYAIMQGHDEIARVLIESGCDLKKQYVSGEQRFTIGDLTVIAKKPVLTDLVRRRGGSFTIAEASR